MIFFVEVEINILVLFCTGRHVRPISKKGHPDICFSYKDMFNFRTPRWPPSWIFEVKGHRRFRK